MDGQSSHAESPMPPTLRVYLAGPDVFRPDAAHWAAEARAACARHHLQALIPLDNGATTAEAIYQANLRLIHEADGLVANLNPFRGHEPDSGTCVEIGVALALGKPVLAYLGDDRPLATRLDGERRADGVWDAQGLRVEDFGLPVNLMLAIPCRIVAGGLEEALVAFATLAAQV